MRLVKKSFFLLNRFDLIVLIKALIVSVFALYFLFEMGIWQTILAPEIFYKKAFVLLGFSFLYFVAYQFKSKVDLKRLVFLICLVDVIFISVYALYSSIPLNLFVGILSLNILIAGFNLGKIKTLFISASSIFVFTLFLSQRNLLDINYSFVYFLLNSFSFVLYAAASLYLQMFFKSNQAEVKVLSKHLKKQRELNKVVLNSMDSAVYITGFDGVPIAINKSAQDLEMSSQLLESLKDASKKLLIKSKIAEEIEISGQFFKIYGSVLESDLSVEDTRQNILLLTDETDFIKAQKDLEQTKKLAAIGTLSAGLAHEIRNPLAGISGSVELIKEGAVDSDDQKKLFETVLKEIDRLNLLVTDFLNFAQPEVKCIDEIEVSAFAGDVVSLISQDKRSQEVTINLDCEKASLKVDESKLRQVLINLIINAVQAFDGSKDTDKKINITGLKTDEGYCLKVEDNGKGIPKKELSVIFEPFHTTKDKGTGLGLALSHRILDGHGAKLSVESELGKGTVFSILF